MKICSNLNRIIDDLRQEVSDKNEYISEIEKQRNDAQWSLGEHRQWLQDATIR